MSRRIPKKIRWDHPQYDDLKNLKAHFYMMPGNAIDDCSIDYLEEYKSGSLSCYRVLMDNARKLREIGLNNFADDIAEGIEILKLYKDYARWSYKLHLLMQSSGIGWTDLKDLEQSEIVVNPSLKEEIPF